MRNNLHLTFLPFSAFLLLSGCFIAPKTVGPQVNSTAINQERQFQYQLLLENITEQHVRTQQVGWNILYAGRDLCRNNSTQSGVSFITQQDIEKGMYGAANILWGLADFPKVIGIVKGNGAYRAGLRVKDTLVGIEGQRFHRGEDAQKKISDYLDKPRKKYRVRILRKGEEFLIEWQARPVCNYPVVLEQDDAINAYADGKRIVILSGMVDFATKDEELALVIAHELAHNLEGHVDAKRTNATGGLLLGTILDVVLRNKGHFGRLGQQIGGQAHSVAFEKEADYVGMYILARSPYNIKDAPKFWRRMALKSGGKSINFSSSHPTTVDRLLSLDATVKEIEMKRQKNLPLLPNSH